MAKEATQKYQIYCYYCGRNQIVTEKKDIEGLQQIPRADVPGGAPFWDPAQKKIVEKKPLPQRKMFKCPRCGRGVVVKKYVVPISEEDTDDKSKLDGRESGFIGPSFSGDAPGGFDEGRSEIP